MAEFWGKCETLKQPFIFLNAKVPISNQVAVFSNVKVLTFRQTDAPFSDSENGQNGTFRRKKNVINFQTKKEPKMKFFDFGAFQNKMQMSSHDKIIFRILFETFHITSRNVRQRPGKKNLRRTP